ncbi:MAG: class I SAM-dependent methyltransferase [Candidatus Cloacimonetes bacterium]|nr:class I SAM-dependent methyltransferase [Candidatus Cloacimonadota bacterium]
MKVTQEQNNIDFNKYKTRGAGYHWDQISSHPIKMNAFVKARYKKCIKLLLSELHDVSGKKILDFGCGDGVLTYELEKCGAHAHGVDLSEIAVQFGKERHLQLGSNATFKVGSCLEAPYEDNYFDAIVSSDVIEHVPSAKKFLEEVKRILKPNGVAIISTPIRFTESPLDKMHVVEWFEEEYKTVVQEVFENSSFEYSHPIFWLELINRNRYCRLLVNLLSLVKNPFESSKSWRYPSMQYAIIKN